MFHTCWLYVAHYNRLYRYMTGKKKERIRNKIETFTFEFLEFGLFVKCFTSLCCGYCKAPRIPYVQTTILNLQYPALVKNYYVTCKNQG